MFVIANRGMSMKAGIWAVVALGAIAWAQDQTLIRVSTRLVEINAIVRDKNGPVRGLTKKDFTILDRGHAREISFFSANATGATDVPADQVPPGTYSNQPGRSGITALTATVVLLDG